MRVKLFSKNNPLGKRGRYQLEFEDEINQWLSENPQAEIIDIKQTASGGSYSPSLWLISIWYNEEH